MFLDVSKDKDDTYVYTCFLKIHVFYYWKKRDLIEWYVIVFYSMLLISCMNRYFLSLTALNVIREKWYENIRCWKAGHITPSISATICETLIKLRMRQTTLLLTKLPLAWSIKTYWINIVLTCQNLHIKSPFIFILSSNLKFMWKLSNLLTKIFKYFRGN